MINSNVELLNNVIADKLNKVLEGVGEESETFNEAMKAIDRMIEIDKNNVSLDKNDIDKTRVNIEKDKVDNEKERYNNQDEIEKKRVQIEERKLDEDIRRDRTANRKIDVERDIELKKLRRETLIKAIEIGAAIVVAPLIEYGSKAAFAKILCEFEKDYTFTTTAGRSLASMFKFKK